MGRLISNHAWDETPFGSLQWWCSPLRVAVNLMLSAGTPTAIAWGPEYRLLYNDRYRDILDDKHPLALGARAEDIFPEVWSDVRPLFEQAYRDEPVVIEDLAIPFTRAGETRVATFSGGYTPLHDENGAVIGFVAAIVETTSRVAREHERAQVFDTILSAIADFAYSFDVDGRFVYVNKALLDLWGLPLEEAVGKNFFDLKYPPELAARLQRQIQEVFDTKSVVRDETPYVSPTGVEGYYEYIFSPIFGTDGTVAQVAGSTREISNRKKLERELRDVQARMEAALSAGAIGTWAWDIQRDRIYGDRNLARFFGVSDTEAQGGASASYFRAMHEDDRERVLAKLHETLEAGTQCEMEYRVTGRDGQMRWVVARGSVVRNPAGLPISMPGTVLDITERKKLEARVNDTIRDLESAKQQLEKQADDLEALVEERTARLQETITELESFSYSISHDLRGPLRVMQSFAQALREDCGNDVSDAGKDYIRRIVSSAERMDRIIQDVLVYSRIARTDLQLERVELDEFVRSLLESYPAFHDAEAEIMIEGPLPGVMASPAALTQCLANLIGNATKFVAPGVRPIITISCRTAEGRAYVSIRDNGIGIPLPAQEAIFGVFCRLDTAYEGTGIGLAIVRKAVERMGGRITLESELGRGTVFTFDLGLAAP